MTIDQWITAGIPLAAVITGVLRNEFWLSGVERHVSGRVESLKKVMNSRFTEVNNRKYRPGYGVAGADAEAAFFEKSPALK